MHPKTKLTIDVTSLIEAESPEEAKKKFLDGFRTRTPILGRPMLFPQRAAKGSWTVRAVALALSDLPAGEAEKDAKLGLAFPGLGIRTEIKAIPLETVRIRIDLVSMVPARSNTEALRKFQNGLKHVGRRIGDLEYDIAAGTTRSGRTFHMKAMFEYEIEAGSDDDEAIAAFVQELEYPGEALELDYELLRAW